MPASLDYSLPFEPVPRSRCRPARYRDYRESPEEPEEVPRKRRCPNNNNNSNNNNSRRGNFASFFWDAHADLVRDMMSHDSSFSSNGSFCDYSFSTVGGGRGAEEQRGASKDPRFSLATGGDSGVASSCSGASRGSSASSAHSAHSAASPLYTQIRSTSRILRRTQSSSSLGETYERVARRGDERRGGEYGRGTGGERSTVGAERRRERRAESPEARRGPQRNTYASASFHHSRVSTATSNEGRYNVKKRKIYENLDVSGARSTVDTAPPCCWECFEARVERERVSAGLPTRTAYLPEPAPSENHYENISFDDAPWVDRSMPAVRHAVSGGPALPPRKPRRGEEEEEESSQSDTYARLCSIEFCKLHAAESLFSQERLASLQKKIERLLLVKSNIDLSDKGLAEPDFARAANQVVYRIERRLRAIEAYSQPQFKKITADLISLLASAEKKQKSKMDTFKRGIARAYKVIF